jgi:hypothetical protein
MNSTDRAFRLSPLAPLFFLLLTLGMLAPAEFTQAAESPAPSPSPSQSVPVVGLLGLAQYAKAGGSYAPLKVGMVLQAGDQVQTATGSALDLNLGREIGTVRLLQSTTLRISALSAKTVGLDLRGGEIVGQVKKRPDTKFEVEVPGGIAGVVEGEFRLNARAYLVLLEGTAVFVEAPPMGDPVAHTLSGRSKPVYFSPTEHGVRPAPKELVREIRAQAKARLPKK